jgi:hypothetical protein
MNITQFVTSRRDEALLLGDHNSYRAQLSRRILTLRRKLGRSTAKNAKYTPKEHITAADIARDHEYVYIQAAFKNQFPDDAQAFSSFRFSLPRGHGPMLCI